MKDRCQSLENRYTSSRRVEGSNPSPSAELHEAPAKRALLELDNTLGRGCPPAGKGGLSGRNALASPNEPIARRSHKRRFRLRATSAFRAKQKRELLPQSGGFDGLFLRPVLPAPRDL